MGDYGKSPLGVMWLPLLGLLFYTGVVAAQYGSLQDGFVTYYTDAPSPVISEPLYRKQALELTPHKATVYRTSKSSTNGFIENPGF